MDDQGFYIREVPDKFFHLSEDGTFHKNIKSDARIENSQYWKMRQDKIGLVLLCSAGVLVLFLLYETDMLQFFWEIGIGALAKVLGL